MKKILILLLCLLLVSCNKETTNVDYEKINQIDFSNVQELELSLHSNEYMLVDLSEFKVLYGKDYDKQIYPASLTKLMTLDVVLNNVSDLNETSSVSSEQISELIQLDASLAYLKSNYEYSIKDLLYALILPSGADSAKAIENYFDSKDMDILVEIQKQLDKLGCNNTRFVNTTGLHDDDHYTSLNDLLKILLDILSYDEGRKILETIDYEMTDGTTLFSTIKKIAMQECSILGGKTGFTDESGQSVMILYRINNHSYVLMLANAIDDRPNRETWHFDDAIEIINYLY